MNFTDKELNILKVLASFRNYDNVQSELGDNAVGLYMSDIVRDAKLEPEIARGVLSSLIMLMENTVIWPPMRV